MAVTPLRTWLDARVRSFAAVWCLVAAATALSGCAFTTGHVNVAYESQGPAARLATANTPHVAVVVIDRRPTQVLGEKKNGFGMKTADIEADNDVPATVKNAFETELRNRGFVEGSGGNVVEVKLDHFQNQYSLGFFSGEGVATIGMQVSVERPDGSTAYSKYITGKAENWIELMGAGNAQTLLDGALRDGIERIFDDGDFTNALTQS